MSPRRLVDATGTRNRINALHAAGHTSYSLGQAYPRGPVSKQCVHQWRTATRVAAETHDAWKQLYEQLAGTTGACLHGRIIALRAGHRPPEAWVGIDMDCPEARPRTAAEPPPDEDEAA